MSSQLSLVSLLGKLWLHIAPNRRIQLAAIGGLMLVSTVAELASIGAVLPFLGALTAPEQIFVHPMAKPLIDSMGLTEPQQLILPLTILFGLAAVFSGAVRLALLWGQTRLGNAIGVDLGSEAYRRTLYQSYQVHAMRNSSEVVAGQVTKINTVIYFIIIPLLTLITSMFIVTVVVALMLWVEPLLTLVTFLVLSGIYLIIIQISKKRVSIDSQQVTIEQNNVTQVVQEGLGGIRDVLIDGLQELYSRIYRLADTRLRHALANIAILSGAPRPLIEALGVVLIGGLAYVLSSRPEGMVSAIPILGVLALAAQRLLPLVQQIYTSWTSMHGGLASLSDVLKLLDQPLPGYSKQSRPKPIVFEHQISLHDLYFRYTPDTPWVLRGISLEISRGSRVGFIGTTGSGKSTLLDVVMGLLMPTTGQLCIDNTVLDATNYRSWQVHIAHVPQAIYLSDNSIAENIAFGESSESIDLERVREAAKRAQIADTIESWEQGYNTFVGERGIRLSGGQRQRIGIARALYKQAEVIVFDEATSALDNETERSVMQAIDSLGNDLTIFIVAHRLSTLQNCNNIVELENGVVVRSGTFHEMVNNRDS